MKESIKAYAKINISLDVIRKLSSGYHEIQSVMHKIDLCDHISISGMDEDRIILTCDNPEIPRDSSNTAYKAVELLKNRFSIRKGVIINIQKNIPVCAGLGGGSSDAASTLLMLNDIWNLDLSLSQLSELGAEIGMDVPFFINSDAAFVSGKGENVQSIKPSEMYVVVVTPDIRILTQEAYQLLDLNNSQKSGLKTPKVLEALKKSDIQALSDAMHNDFEEKIMNNYPELAEIKEKMLKNKALNAMLSGSGSTVFSISNKKEIAEKIYESFKDDYEHVYLCRTVS